MLLTGTLVRLKKAERVLQELLECVSGQDSLKDLETGVDGEISHLLLHVDAALEFFFFFIGHAQVQLQEALVRLTDAQHTRPPLLRGPTTDLHERQSAQIDAGDWHEAAQVDRQATHFYIQQTEVLAKTVQLGFEKRQIGSPLLFVGRLLVLGVAAETSGQFAINHLDTLGMLLDI